MKEITSIGTINFLIKNKNRIFAITVPCNNNSHVEDGLYEYYDNQFHLIVKGEISHAASIGSYLYYKKRSESILYFRSLLEIEKEKIYSDNISAVSNMFFNEIVIVCLKINNQDYEYMNYYLLIGSDGFCRVANMVGYLFKDFTIMHGCFDLNVEYGGKVDKYFLSGYDNSNNLVWSINLKDDFGFSDVFVKGLNVYSSNFVIDDMLYLTEGRGGICCVDKNGGLVWSHLDVPRKRSYYPHESRIYGYGNTSLYILDKDTGDIILEKSMSPSLEKYNSCVNFQFFIVIENFIFITLDGVSSNMFVFDKESLDFVSFLDFETKDVRRLPGMFGNFIMYHSGQLLYHDNSGRVSVFDIDLSVEHNRLSFDDQ